MRTPPENAGKKARCKNCAALVAIPERSPSQNPTQLVKPKPVQARPVQAKPVQAKPVQARPVQPPAPATGFDHLVDPFSFDGPLGYNVGNSWTAPKPQKSSHSPWLAVMAVVASLCLVGVMAGVIALINIVSKANLVSAKRPDNNAARATAPNGGTVSTELSKTKQFADISEAEALEVGNRFVSAVKSGDLSTCDRIFNIENVINSIALEVQMSERDKRSFLTGFRAQPSLAQQVHLATQQGGSYTLLRALKRDGQSRVIIRLDSEQGGFNYHELMLDRAPSNEVIVSDVYLLSLGEAFGDTIRRVVIMMVASQNQSLLARLSGSRRQMAQHAKTLAQITRLSKVSPHQTLAEMKKLPIELQQEKTLMLIKLTAASQVGDAEHQATFEEFRRLFPNDPSLDLHSIDYHITRNETDQAIAAIKRLLLYIGGDAMLEALISNLQK